MAHQIQLAAPDPIADFLRQQGAEQLPHARGRSLCQHLLGTRDLLVQWGEPPWVCAAGALHSIYASEVYEPQLVPLEHRGAVQQLIGPKAERLVYLFSAILRADLLGQLEARVPVPPQGLHVRRHADSGRESLALAEIEPLVAILLANEAEHETEAGAVQNWRARLDAWRLHLQRGAALRGRQRFSRYIDQLAHNHAAPMMPVYPELGAQPFYEAASFPLVQALEDAYPEIQREIAGIDPGAFHREAENIKRAGQWDVFLLWERGRKSAARCAQVPVTAQLIEQHATVRTLAGLCYFSRMKPGTHIAAHRGPTNLRVRCHLGVQVPAGDCGIWVGGKVGRWQQGRCLVLDDFFEHQAWNRTAQDRIVLVVDLWHPDLTAEEVELLEGLHRYAAAQAASLKSYWDGNAKAVAELR